MDIAEILMLVKWDGGSAIKGLKELDSKVDETGGNVGKLSKMAILGGAIAAVGTFTAVLGAATDAASKDQSAHASLQNTLKNMKQVLPDGVLNNTIAAMDKFGHTGDDTQAALQRLITAGMPASEAVKHMGDVADLAANQHTNLADAATMVIKGAEGQGRAFKALGITVPPAIASASALASAQTAVAKAQDKLTTLQDSGTATAKQLTAAHQALSAAQEKVKADTQAQANPLQNINGLFDSMHKKIGGAADASSKTFPGALAALKASFVDSVLVPVGNMILPMLGKLAAWFQQNEGTFRTIMVDALNALKVAFGLVAGAIGVLANHMDIIGPILVGIIGYFVGMKLAMLAQMAIGFVGFIVELITQFGIVAGSEGVVEAATWSMNAAFGANPIGLVVIAIAALVAAAVLLVTHLKQVGQFFGTVFNAIKAIVGDAVDWIKQNWMLLVAIFLGPLGLIVALVVTHFTQIRDFIGKIISDVVGFFEALPGRVMGFIGNLWNNYIVKPFDDFKKGVSTIVDDIVQFFEKLPGRIMKAIGSIPGLVNNMVKGIPIIGGVVGGAEGVVGGAAGAVGSVLGHLAGGGDAAGGSLNVVGEHGPELVRFGANAHVFPNNMFRSAMQSAAGNAGGGVGAGGDTYNTVVNNPHSDVDVQAALEADRRLNQLAARGINPGARQPMAVPA